MDLSILFLIFMFYMSFIEQSSFNFVFGSTTCPTGEYWEELFDRCEKCNTLCEQARMRGNVKACEEACPGYMENLEISSTGRPMSSHLIPTTAVPNIVPKAGDKAINNGTEIWKALGIAAAVGFFCVIPIVVLIMVVCMKKRGKEIHSISYNYGWAFVKKDKPHTGIQDTEPPSPVHPVEKPLL